MIIYISIHKREKSTFHLHTVHTSPPVALVLGNPIIIEK